MQDAYNTHQAERLLVVPAAVLGDLVQRIELLERRLDRGDAADEPLQAIAERELRWFGPGDC